MPCLIVVWILNKLRDGDASTHQDLLHPGERSLKGENKDGRRAEGDGEAADEVVDNVQQGQLGVIGSTCEIRHE